MPIVEPSYKPAPKSGCTGVFAPMKLMIASELGSIGAFEISRFHALSVGKGMKPLRLAARPRLMPLHESWPCSGKERIAERATSRQIDRMKTSGRKQRRY